MSRKKWKKVVPKPKWRFSAAMMDGFYIISVYRGERCYAEQFFKEYEYIKPIFGRFEFLKGMFK